MQKVAFAVGDRGLEDYLRTKLKNEFTFVGATVFREGVVRLVGQTNPDILILREYLEGSENILSVIYDLQMRHSNLRIVFLAGQRDAGDEFLSTLVNYGIYDILHGQAILAPDIIRVIREPNKRADVMYLQPKPTLDPSGKKVIFESPDKLAPQQTKEVVKEIYVEADIEDEELRIRAQMTKDRQAEPGDAADSTENSSKVVVPAEELELMHEIEEVDEPVIEKEAKPKKGFLFPKLDIRKEEREVSPPTEEKVQKQTSEESEQSAGKGFLSRLMARETFNHEQVKPLQSILTFVGLKAGVGNTSLAFNTALMLAQKHKVLYVEMNDKTPAIPVWYDLSHIDKGIETSLEAIEKGRIDKIKEGILSVSEMKSVDTPLKAVYKKMPDNLDILVFSKRYTLRLPGEMPELNYQLSRDLYLYLLYQTDYNYVILDVPPDMFHPATYHAVTYSNHVFCTLTQDVATIEKAENDFHELEKQGVNISKKVKLLINRYEKNVIDSKGIMDWLNLNDAICIPEASTDFVYANFHAIPFSMHNRSSVWKNVWKTIMKDI